LITSKEMKMKEEDCGSSCYAMTRKYIGEEISQDLKSFLKHKNTRETQWKKIELEEKKLITTKVQREREVFTTRKRRRTKKRRVTPTNEYLEKQR
jgi:uncharacterized protein (DUF342 family)